MYQVSPDPNGNIVTVGKKIEKKNISVKALVHLEDTHVKQNRSTVNPRHNEIEGVP